MRAEEAAEQGALQARAAALRAAAWGGAHSRTETRNVHFSGLGFWDNLTVSRAGIFGDYQDPDLQAENGQGLCLGPEIRPRRATMKCFLCNMATRPNPWVLKILLSYNHTRLFAK